MKKTVPIDSIIFTLLSTTKRYGYLYYLQKDQK